MSRKLLDILVCPETRLRLEVADDALIESVNVRIRDGRLTNRAGEPVESTLEGGLLRSDGRVLYPIVDRIPILLADQAIDVERTSHVGKDSI